MSDEKSSLKKHFVLVHGFGQGAWCWYKLLTILRSNDQHKATAIDLAGCGVHPKQLHQISSFSDYVQPLMDFLLGLPDEQKVILVGHSYGGFPISLAMERFPGKVSLAVFVTAYMPNCTDPPGTLVHEFFKRNSTKSFMDSEFKFDEESGKVLISGTMGLDYIAAELYDKCSLEDVELGKMLVRLNLFFLNDLIETPNLLTEERYGKVKRCYIVCEGDGVMEEELQRYMIEKSPADDVRTIEGAGHMVMLSKPQQLCSALLDLAKKY